MDLKSFADQNAHDGTQNQPPPQTNNMDETDIRKAINHYSGMDNNALMAELIKQVGFQKEKGNSKHMLETIERIKPMLNNEQKKRLEDIVGKIGI